MSSLRGVAGMPTDNFFDATHACYGLSLDVGMLTLNALTFEDRVNPALLFTHIADKLATTTLHAVNIDSVSGQLIGLKLYSQRDTHVVATTGISTPTIKAVLLSYNDSSIVGPVCDWSNPRCTTAVSARSKAAPTRAGRRACA